MQPDLSSLSKLLQSKSPKAQFFAVAICFMTFLPSVFRVIGDGSLTVWQRLEQLSYSVAQTLLTVSALAVPPEALTEGESRNAEGE